MLGGLYHKSLFLAKGLKRSSVSLKFFSTKTASEEPKKEKTGIWAVEKREARPDWKRPSATFSVEYFRSKKSAEEYKQELVQEALEEYKEWLETDEEAENYSPKDEDEFFADYAEKLFESQGYMDMEAYSISLYEIELPVEDANIEKELSSVPK